MKHIAYKIILKKKNKINMTSKNLVVIFVTMCIFVAMNGWCFSCSLPSHIQNSPLVYEMHLQIVTPTPDLKAFRNFKVWRKKPHGLAATELPCDPESPLGRSRPQCWTQKSPALRSSSGKHSWLHWRHDPFQQLHKTNTFVHLAATEIVLHMTTTTASLACPRPPRWRLAANLLLYWRHLQANHWRKR